MLRDLDGYCLMKYGQDGQQTTSQPPQPPLQVQPQTQPPPQMQSPPNQPVVDANGQCCPTPNPININITNSQDTNSRNVTTRRAPQQMWPVARRPPVQPVAVQRPIIRYIDRPPQTVYVNRFVPQIRRVVQPIPVYRTQTVIKEVPREVVKEVPVDHYTERVIQMPVTGCEGKEFNYPAFY